MQDGQEWAPFVRELPPLCLCAIISPFDAGPFVTLFFITVVCGFSLVVHIMIIVFIQTIILKKEAL